MPNYDEEGQVCRVDDPFTPAPPAPIPALAPPPIVQGMPPGPWAPGYTPDAAGPFLDLYGPPAPAAPTAPTHKHLNDDPALGSLRAALDDPSLTTAARAAMMLDYRNKNLALVDFGAMSKMQKNDPSMPLYGAGDKKGLQHALYEKLGSDPKMQAMMTQLSARIAAEDPDKLDIQKIFAETQADALKNSGDGKGTENTAESNLMALQAMATLSNYYKFEGGGLPKEIADKLPKDLWNNIQAAGKAITYSKSKDAAVMSHDNPAGPEAGKPFTADHNFHFFSHAYLTASLVKEHGVSPHQAEAMSAFIGTQYELQPGSLQEGSGNSGIKDCLMNAEGGAFGTRLMSKPGTALPGKWDGPGVESRDQSKFANLTTLPDEAQAISDEAADLSKTGLLGSLIQGLMGRKIESDVENMRKSGLPPAPSGTY